MKKTILYSLLTIAAAGFVAHSASAAVFDNTAEGGKLTIDCSNVDTTAGNLEFNPSTKVRITGGSDVTSYALSAYHTGVLGKASAQAYGMAADSNKQYVLDIGPDGTTTHADPLALVAADTNAATAFAGGWVSI